MALLHRPQSSHWYIHTSLRIPAHTPELRQCTTRASTLNPTQHPKPPQTPYSTAKFTANHSPNARKYHQQKKASSRQVVFRAGAPAARENHQARDQSAACQGCDAFSSVDHILLPTLRASCTGVPYRVVVVVVVVGWNSSRTATSAGGCFTCPVDNVSTAKPRNPLQNSAIKGGRISV